MGLIALAAPVLVARLVLGLEGATRGRPLRRERGRGRLSEGHSGLLCRQRQEVLDGVVTDRREHRFGMEPHALDEMLTVAYTRQ